MTKTKIFVLPELFEKVFQNDGDVADLFLRLDEIYSFLIEQKIDWGVEICFDGESLGEFQEMGFYEARQILSYLSDTTRFFSPVKALNSQDYSFYQLDNKKGVHFQEINSPTYSDLCASVSSSDLRIVGYKRNELNILRIHNYDDTDRPVIVSVQNMGFKLLELELFFKVYIQPLFKKSSEEFLVFKNNYFSFIESFDWQNWSPKKNPAPAHSLLKVLTKHYIRRNDDSHHLVWGYIMAFLNGARYNRALTELNSGNKRVNDIFQSQNKKDNTVLFFSIDTENGELEIYNQYGKHINKVYGIKSGLKDKIRKYTIDVPKSLWHG